MEYTRSEILAAREAWIEYLMKPHRRKFRGSLANPKRGDERCCIGHATHLFFGLKKYGPSDLYKYHYKDNTSTAHEDLIEKLGLHSSAGSILHAVNIGKSLRDIEKFIGKFNEENKHRKLGKYDQLDSLARVNDWTMTSPQKIGEYLLHVIEGGDDTPFVSLSEYPE